MKNAIKTLEAEIENISDKIKQEMILNGTYENKYESLLGEHYTAIDTLKGIWGKE